MQFKIVIIRYNLYQQSKEPAVKVDVKIEFEYTHKLIMSHNEFLM